LINGDVVELKWNHVSGWANAGGSLLSKFLFSLFFFSLLFSVLHLFSFFPGTNRSQPILDTGLTAFNLQKYNVNALLVIGGFEAYTSVLQLVRSRDQYPQFCIPILCIPATISNNVPGTDYSLGSDTSLNTIIKAYF